MTFRLADGLVLLPTFDLGHSGDIYFEFKTTKENAVLLHSKVRTSTRAAPPRPASRAAIPSHSTVL